MTGNRPSSRGRLRGLLTLTLLLALLHTAAAAQTTGPKVDILQVGGALDGTIADYLGDALRTARDEGVEVVVVQLTTPGTLGVEPQGLVDLIAQSPVPIAVWVGPPGGAVTGAGVQVALAADVLAMAPGALLGGAVPADLAGDADAGERRAVAGVLADLARQRGRDPELAAAYATDGAAVVAAPDGAVDLDADAALPPNVRRGNVQLLDDQELQGGAADLIASSLPEVLQRLDGREVTRADGSETTLTVDPVTATIRFNNQGLLGRVLHTVSTPTLAYLLLVGGLIALLFEWFQPGFGVAGISGGLLAALGGYGLLVLPTHWWAVALVVLGLVLLALDLAMASLGTVTAAGAVALTAGSWWLYSGPPTVRLTAWLVALVVISAVVFFVFVMTTVLRAQGIQARANIDAVMGRTGVVRSMLNPQGHVYVAGALWRAQAPDGSGTLRTGTQVRVTGTTDETTLLVEPVDEPVDQPGTPLPTRP